MLKTVAVVAAATLILAVQGCGASNTEEDKNSAFIESQVRDADKSGSKGQREVVDDGVVDGSEYESQFDALRICVESGGGKFTDFGVSKFDGVTRDFDVTSDSLEPDRISTLRESCFGSELLYAQAIYKATHANVLDPALMVPTADCLKSQGVELTGQETNLEQLVDAAKPKFSSSVPVFRCASEAAHKVYPREFAKRDISMGY